MKKEHTPLIGIIMGSDSDWPTLKAAVDICDKFDIAYEVHVVSAHRTPEKMANYARKADSKGIKVIIAGAGGAAHLPGMLASYTALPVIGVPVMTEALKGMDSLLSIVQMPGGIPVATVAIGGGKNAGLLALEIIATADSTLFAKLTQYKKSLAAASKKKDTELNKQLNGR